MSDIQQIFGKSAVRGIKDLAKMIGEAPGLTRTQKALFLSSALSELFKELDDVARTAPDKAPELWKERADKGENIYDFIRRVYADYIDTIRRKDLRRLDFRLYKSLYYPGHNQSNALDLPTTKEANNNLLASLNGSLSFTDIRNQMPETLRRQLALYRTMSTRKSKVKNKTNVKIKKPKTVLPSQKIPGL